MNYKQQKLILEDVIESLIQDIVEDRTFRSPRAEERLTALCLSREYLKDKIKEEATLELHRFNQEIIELEGINESKTIK